MGFETGSTYISQLVAANPTASDDVSEGDDHLRMMKTVLKTQFSGLTGTTAISSSEAELNILDGVTATAAELNYLDITTLGTSADSKALTQASGVVTIAGDVVVSGTTPKVTIGDAGTEDTMLVFDGNAVDYRVGLDDGTDNLEIGVGSAHGSTTAITIDSSADMTLGGYLACADEQIRRPEFIDYAETVNAVGDVGGGTDALDITSGNVVTATVSTGTQTFTFTNPSATGKACSFTLHLTNGGSQTVNWPGAVDWIGGSAPSLTSSGLDILMFTTIDAGTTWLGFLAGADIK